LGRRPFRFLLRRLVFGNGTGFVWYGEAEEQEVLDGALVDVVEAGFVTMEEAQLRRGGQFGEGGGDARGLIAGRLMAEGLFHEAILDGPGAAHAPIGRGHFFDHAELNAIGGGEPRGMLADEVVKARTRFVFEDHALGQEAVAKGVGGGAFLAIGGDGASGAGSVGAGSIDTSK
jgi:hypothetical protein